MHSVKEILQDNTRLHLLLESSTTRDFDILMEQLKANNKKLTELLIYEKQ